MSGILRNNKQNRQYEDQQQYFSPPPRQQGNRQLVSSSSSQRPIYSAQKIQNSGSLRSTTANPHYNLTRKMVRVINGKIIPAPEEHTLQQSRGAQSLQQLSRKSNASSISVGINNPDAATITVDNVESLIGSQKGSQQLHNRSAVVTQGGSRLNKTADCQAACKSTMENEVDSFINYNDIYYKHVKGLCVCYQCTCGKHKCAFAKNSHLKQPFNAPPAKSIYKINYVGKQGLKDVDFDYSKYENMPGNAKAIDHLSVNHKDYRKPGMDSYGTNANFKPVQHYEANPLEVGRSHYKRDFLEWGCVPYQPLKGYSQRTTIDAMPFHGLTTYTKDFYKMNAPMQQVENRNHKQTTLKSPIPFLGVTTNQDTYKAYKQPDRAIKYKASDELFTGAPSYQGQYNSLHNKDFVNYSNICPVEKSIKSTATHSQL